MNCSLARSLPWHFGIQAYLLSHNYQGKRNGANQFSSIFQESSLYRFSYFRKKKTQILLVAWVCVEITQNFVSQSWKQHLKLCWEAQGTRGDCQSYYKSTIHEASGDDVTHKPKNKKETSKETNQIDNYYYEIKRVRILKCWILSSNIIKGPRIR